MFNLIRMNFYRMFHQKSFYVCLAVTAVIGWFMVFLVWMTPKLEEKAREAREAKALAAQEGGESADEGFQAGFVMGFTDGADGEMEEIYVLEEFNVSDFIMEFCCSGFNVIMLSVGVSLIVNSERKRGYIKNLGGQIKPRGMFVAAKLPVILFDVAAVYAAAGLSIALSGRIYYDRYTLGDAAALGGTLLQQLLLGTAFGALVMLFCTMARSAVAGILVGVAVAVNITPMLYGWISRFAVAYLGASEGFNVSVYTLEFYLMNTVGSVDVSRSLIVGMSYLLLATALGWFIMEKRDI